MESMVTAYPNLHIYRFSNSVLVWNAALLSPLVLSNERQESTDITRIIQELRADQRFVQSPRGSAFLSSLNGPARLLFEPRRPAINFAYFVITRRCNLRCDYCFVTDRDSPAAFSEDDIRRSLDWLAPLFDPFATDPSIVLYGGEPLMAPAAVLAAIDHIQDLKFVGKLPAALKTVLITNGTLITSEIAEHLATRSVTAFVSIDGRAPAHDHHRKTAGDSGSSKAALEGYARLKRAGVPTGLSVTATPANISTLREDLVDYLLPLDPIGITYNIPRTHRLDAASARSLVPGGDLADALFEAYMICRQHGIREGRSARIVDSVINGRIRLTDCAGCGQQLTLYPDGTVTPCHVLDESSDDVLCHVGDGTSPVTLAASPILREWMRYSPLLNPCCLSCPAVACCGGGCRLLFIDPRQSAYQDMYCTYVRRLLHRTLEHVADQVTQSNPIAG